MGAYHEDVQFLSVFLLRLQTGQKDKEEGELNE